MSISSYRGQGPDRRMDQQTDKRTDGPANEQTDRRTDGEPDRQSRNRQPGSSRLITQSQRTVVFSRVEHGLHFFFWCVRVPVLGIIKPVGKNRGRAPPHPPVSMLIRLGPQECNGQGKKKPVPTMANDHKSSTLKLGGVGGGHGYTRIYSNRLYYSQHRNPDTPKNKKTKNEAHAPHDTKTTVR